MKNGAQCGYAVAGITQAVSCNYISDLHTSGHMFDSRAKNLISQIPDGRYTLDEWNSALSYITGIKRSYKSIQKVKERFYHMT